MSKTVTYADKPWLKSYDPGVPHSIDYEKLCIPDFLERSAQQNPNNKALSFQGFTLTYRQMKDMVDRMATCLTDFGIRKGDSVAIHLPNIIPCVVAYYAILKIGGVVVMNNPLYSTIELEHQFGNSESKVLITLDLLANTVIDLRPKTKIKQIIYTSIGDYLPFPKSLLFPLVAKKQMLAADVKPAPDVYKWKDMIAKYKPAPPKVDLTFDDIAQIQYTGGTTGVSKGVVLSHGNLSKQVQQLNAWYPNVIEDPSKDSMLGALPFFHVFGLSCAMNFAVLLNVCDILVPKPQPDPLIETFEKFKPTFAPMVPTMFIGLLNHPKIKKLDLSHVRGAFSGSAPLPVEVIKEWETVTGSVISEGFGMTESTPVTHMNPFRGNRKPGSIGLPAPDTEVKIIDIEGNNTEMPAGESGEMVIRGPQVMQGYWKMPEETKQTLKDGWLHTGDIAIMDEEGYFFIVDRLKDMVISGGYNVYPREIDEIFYEHPAVEEACAIGIPHKSRGEAIKVFVVLKQGQTATVEDFMNFCKDKLATYKLPTEIEFRDELPKTSVGKILRKELRAQEMEKIKAQQGN